MTYPARPMTDDLRRVLVIRRRALGDALVTMPAVLALVDALPAAEVDLLIDEALADLFGGWDRVRVLPWKKTGVPGTPAWIRALRARRYDLVLDYLSTPQTALWTALSGARWRMGFDMPWRSWAYNLPVPRNRTAGVRLDQFAGESFLDPLRRLGLEAEPWRPGLDIARDGASAVGDCATWARELTDRPRPLVGLVLSATWPAKAWPATEAARLVRLLADDGATPVLLPGPGDAAVVESLRREVPELEIAPPTDLRELADLLSRLDVLVATDSGPRHLAAAVGVSTVTLFGPTDPRGWNREHPLHVAVRTGETCSPCDLKTCPLADHPCMANLVAEWVREAIRGVLKRSDP